MKKLVYIFMALAITMAGVRGVSAEQVIVPMSAHYSGSNDYTQINIKNLSDQVASVVVTFSPNVTTDGYLTNTFTATTARTFTIAGGTVRTLRTVDTEWFGTTTSLKLARVTIQSSGTDEPFVGPASADGTGIDGAGAGPLSVTAIFIHIEGGVPSGFSYPAIKRTRTWNRTLVGTAAGLVGSATVDNWEQ